MSSASMHNHYLDPDRHLWEDEPPCRTCKHDVKGEDCDLPACDYSPKEETMTNPATHPYTDMVDQMAQQPKRAQILDEVKRIICQDRQDVHGEPEDVFADISEFWSTYINRNYETEIVLNGQDVAVMMCLFKIARYSANWEHKDNLVDLIGYAAIAAELGSTSQ